MILSPYNEYIHHDTEVIQHISRFCTHSNMTDALCTRCEGRNETMALHPNTQQSAKTARRLNCDSLHFFIELFETWLYSMKHQYLSTQTQSKLTLLFIPYLHRMIHVIETALLM